MPRQEKINKIIQNLQEKELEITTQLRVYLSTLSDAQLDEELIVK